ncbi:hypothetical protein [Oceaniglobus trochenteri]|uniref:hypothetical protein n=1 Tax=Oceaniglobus trochenteri TaxID=2763260 RepID=UPI001CFFD383|nr:hypothetical protein [Oceaniglobus trochenteri]
MIHIEDFPAALNRPHVLYRNAFSEGTVTYSAGAATGPNAIDGNTYDAWAPGAVPATASVTLGAAEYIDCLGLAAHTLAANGNTVTVEYLDGSWLEAASFTPESDEPIMAVWPAVKAAQWRVRFSGGTAPLIGVMQLGKRLVFDRGIVGDYTPTNWGRTVEVLGGDTLGGQFLGQRIIRRGGETSVSFGSLEREWFEAQAAEFVRHYDDAKPFFFAGAPGAVPNDLAYCWRPDRSGELRPRYIESGQYVSLQMPVAFHVA